MQQSFSAVACFNSKKKLTLYMNSCLLQMRRQCSIASFQLPLKHLDLLLLGVIKVCMPKIFSLLVVLQLKKN